MCSKLKVSLGTAAVLKLNRVRNLVDPTTAYVMFGERCSNNCEFCSQSEGDTRLSRVIWPEFDTDVFIEAFNNHGKDLVNICIQVTKSKKSSEITLELVRKLKREIIRDIRINISIDLCEWPDMMNDFFEAGVHRIGISIDVVNEKEYFMIKHKDFKKNLDFLIECAERFPGRISTHIIIGLGETSENIFSMIKLFLSKILE